MLLSIIGLPLVLAVCIKDTKWTENNVSASLRSWILSRSGKLSLQKQYYKGKTRLGWKIIAFDRNDLVHNSGYLYGPVDWSGLVSGPEAVFVYPDFETVLVGEFINDTMIAAKESYITSKRCHKGILEIKTAKTKKNGPVFKYRRPCVNYPGDQVIQS